MAAGTAGSRTGDGLVRSSLRAAARRCLGGMPEAGQDCGNRGRLCSVLGEHPDIGFKVMDQLVSMLGERLRAAYNTLEAHL